MNPEEGLIDASDVEDWQPNPNWQPEFEDVLEPEVYDAD